MLNTTGKTDKKEGLIDRICLLNYRTRGGVLCDLHVPLSGSLYRCLYLVSMWQKNFYLAC